LTATSFKGKPFQPLQIENEFPDNHNKKEPATISCKFFVQAIF
jgi:hypothetical protein